MFTPQKLTPHSRPYRPLLLLSLLFLLLSGWSLMSHQTNAARSAEPVSTKRVPNLPFQLFLPLLTHNANSSTTSLTMTPTSTSSLTATNTATPTSSSTVTNTATPTNSPTATNTATPTSSSTATNSATPTSSSTVTNSATPTSSSTVTNSATPTSSSTVTNSATPTNSPTATNTATSIPLSGTGIYKQDGETIYHQDADAYTGACGFIRFFDGSPAFGGENGFRAEFCLDDHGCATSAPVDVTGYFEVPFADLRIEGEGYFQVLEGEKREPVSDKVEFHSEGQGSVVRMDFIECTEGDESEQCQFKPFSFAQSLSMTAEGASEPHRFCPSALTTTPTVTGTPPTSTPTSTVTPTVTGTPPTSTPTVTATPLVGTGIYKQDGETIYHEESEAYTGACGFIHFFDGSPAFGGENGFRAEFCLDDHGCATSAPVDVTGYFEVPFADLRIEGEGYFQVLEGEKREPVSDKVEFNSEDLGSLVRMDFIECTEGDESEQCQFDGFSFAQSSEETSAEERSPLSNRFCPSTN